MPFHGRISLVWLLWMQLSIEKFGAVDVGIAAAGGDSGVKQAVATPLANGWYRSLEKKDK